MHENEEGSTPAFSDARSKKAVIVAHCVLNLPESLEGLPAVDEYL